MKRSFLIKYGELALKGKNRYLFENRLMDQIRHRIDPLGEFKVQKEQGRLFVEPLGEFDEEEILGAISEVFGISHICPVVMIDTDDFETIKDTVVAFIKEQYTDLDFTFKVEARRANKSYPMNSMEICREVGAHILDNFETLKVDVKTPDERVWIEIRDRTYIYSRAVKGLGACR